MCSGYYYQWVRSPRLEAIEVHIDQVYASPALTVEPFNFLYGFVELCVVHMDALHESQMQCKDGPLPIHVGQDEAAVSQAASAIKYIKHISQMLFIICLLAKSRTVPSFQT